MTQALLLSTAVALIVNNMSINNLGIELVESIRLTLMVPLITGVSVGIGVSSKLDLPAIATRSLLLPRLLWSTILVAAAFACAMIPATLQNTSVLPLIRNTATFAGLALLSTALLGSTAAWLGPTGFGLACFLFGANAESNLSLAPWAFVLHDDASGRGMLTAAAVLCIGQLAYGLAGHKGHTFNSSWS